MNEEVKELIDTIEQLLAEYSPNTAPFDLDEYEVEYSQLKGLLDYINQLEEENKKLKNMYNNHYKYAIDMEDKYVTAKGVTDWLKIWLEEEIDRISKLAYKTKPKPYGEELHLHENAINRYRQVLEKIKELEGGSNE